MTSISKNVYNDKLDDIVNKCKHAYSAVKMKPVDVKSNAYIESGKSIIKILNLKLLILLEYQIIKPFLQKTIFQIGLKKFLLLQKLKILCCRHTLLVTLKAKKFLECFTKKKCKNQIKKNLELKK